MAKVLRGHVTIAAYYLEAFADRNAPKAAELAFNTGFGFNLSSAINDDYTANPTDSDTDDSQSVSDVSLVENPTFANYEVSLDGFNDETITAAGVFNKFRDLFKAKNIPYIIGVRIGPEQGVTPVVGDIWGLFHVKTDNAVDIDGDGTEPMQLGARFKPQGWMKPEYEVIA